MSYVLLLQCLLVFILPWFTSAQSSSSSSNDTAQFSVSAPNFLPFCTTSVISWTGGDAPFTLYMGRGNGPIGDDSSLAETFVSYGDNRSTVVYIDGTGEYALCSIKQSTDLSDTWYSHSASWSDHKVPSRGQ